MEIWKDVPGYERLYQVSSLGNVRSLPRNTTNGRNLKPSDGGAGYYTVSLCKGGKVKKVTVHSIVAKAFISNPNNYDFVDHIDEDRKNNRIENLQWCTCKQNNEFRDSVYRKALTRRGKSNRVVSQYSLDGTKLNEFKTLREAAKAVGGQAQNIWKVVKGKRFNAYGFNWRYEA